MFENINWLQILPVYFLIMNIVGFAMMGIDKSKSKTTKGRKKRIPEKNFFIVSLIGGSVGCWAGMYVFRHKTKHWYFVVGIPAIFIVQVALIVLIFMKLGGRI